MSIIDFRPVKSGPTIDTQGLEGDELPHHISSGDGPIDAQGAGVLDRGPGDLHHCEGEELYSRICLYRDRILRDLNGLGIDPSVIAFIQHTIESSSDEAEKFPLSDPEATALESLFKSEARFSVLEARIEVGGLLPFEAKDFEVLGEAMFCILLCKHDCILADALHNSIRLNKTAPHVFIDKVEAFLENGPFSPNSALSASLSREFGHEIERNSIAESALLKGFLRGYFALRKESPWELLKSLFSHLPKETAEALNGLSDGIFSKAEVHFLVSLLNARLGAGSNNASGDEENIAGPNDDTSAVKRDTAVKLDAAVEPDTDSGSIPNVAPIGNTGCSGPKKVHKSGREESPEAEFRKYFRQALDWADNGDVIASDCAAHLAHRYAKEAGIYFTEQQESALSKAFKRAREIAISIKLDCAAKWLKDDDSHTACECLVELALRYSKEGNIPLTTEQSRRVEEIKRALRNLG